MQSFVVRPMTWPVLRLFNRSPLIRVSDRIEAAAVTLAVMFVVIATACAGAAGTMIHDVQARKYLEQAHSRHAVVARAVQNSEPTPEAGAFIVNVRWRLNGVEHTDLLGWNKPVTIGAPLDIWVDDNGSRVAPPSPVARAAVDALSTAVVGGSSWSWPSRRWLTPYAHTPAACGTLSGSKTSADSSTADVPTVHTDLARRCTCLLQQPIRASSSVSTGRRPPGARSTGRRATLPCARSVSRSSMPYSRLGSPCLR